MRVLPPKYWRDVAPGETVFYLDSARRVLANDAAGAEHRIVLAEGSPPLLLSSYDLVNGVELDELDAILALHAAGLNPTPIQE